MAKPCKVLDASGDCINPVDKDMGDGFCTGHSEEWRRSPEFDEAARDDGVRFAAGLRAPSLLKAALRPFKKKWLKRMATETEES